MEIPNGHVFKCGDQAFRIVGVEHKEAEREVHLSVCRQKEIPPNCPDASDHGWLGIIGWSYANMLRGFTSRWERENTWESIELQVGAPLNPCIIYHLRG